MGCGGRRALVQMLCAGDRSVSHSCVSSVRSQHYLQLILTGSILILLISHATATAAASNNGDGSSVKDLRSLGGLRGGKWRQKEIGPAFKWIGLGRKRGGDSSLWYVGDDGDGESVEKRDRVMEKFKQIGLGKRSEPGMTSRYMDRELRRRRMMGSGINRKVPPSFKFIGLGKRDSDAAAAAAAISKQGEQLIKAGHMKGSDAAAH